VFEVLEHTADIGIRARGSDTAELFSEAALGLISLAYDVEAIRPRQEYSLEVKGEGLEELLVNWLNEVLYQMDGEGILLRRFQVEGISDAHIRAEAWGEPKDPDRHAPKLVLKGVTYHQLKVQQEGLGWCAEVYIDI
jgi:SHS2 domain-containing protein